MKIFADKLRVRERLSIYLCAGLGCVAILYLTVISPMNSSINRLKKDVPIKKERLVLMQDAAKEVKLLTGGEKSIKENGLQLTLLHSTAEQHNLRDKIRRLEPDSKNKARVWVEYANYSDLVNWIYVLENSGIEIANLSIDRLEVPGAVNARLTLQTHNKIN